MAVGIFWMCLVLMAIVGVNPPLLPSEKNGIVPKGGEEIVQRMKEREVSLRLHQLCLEKEIADLEARQEAPARPALELERRIQRHTLTVLCAVVLALFVLWGQHWQGATAEHSEEEETDPALLGKARKVVTFLTRPFVLCRGISISMDRTVGYLRLIASRLVQLPWKLLGFTSKNFLL